MAQLVARFHGMEEVRGSIPLISTRVREIARKRDWKNGDFIRTPGI